ncbi:hypothetical protein VOLCADRAFT_63761, partial [Volvox carteri f. nagariensis]
NQSMSFQDLGLDPRLLRALGKRGFTKPTPVQLEAIPRTLEGKDVVARARTGSGKTMAYLLPLLHKLLSTDNISGSFRAIVLVPTRELCQQVGLLSFRPPAPPTTNVRDSQHPLHSPPSTHDSMRVPRSCQCILMSATVSEEVERLQKLVLHNPITLNLAGGPGGTGAPGAAEGGGEGRGGLASGSGVSADIQHFYIQCPRPDKLLHVLALLRLGLVPKKVLIFVNTVYEGVRLRLFLEAFGVRPALLNSELPLNSRSHILASFNKGLFDYLIATDDDAAAGGKKGRKKQKVLLGKAGKAARGGENGGARKDAEFGVTRGIDFKGVRTVLNYDPPSSLQGYVHRVGRTGEWGEEGGPGK